MTAVGTVGATSLAVYVGVLRHRWRQPDFRLTFDARPSSQDCLVIPINGNGRPPHVAFYRLAVHVSSGKASAQDAEVLIAGVRSVPDGTALQIEGQLLVWANTNVGGGDAFAGASKLTVPPGVPRRVDLFHINAADVKGAHPAPIIFAALPRPSDDRHRTGRGDYEIDLVVMARNAKSRRFRLFVAYAGGWGPEAEDIRGQITITGPIRLDESWWEARNPFRKRFIRRCGTV